MKLEDFPSEILTPEEENAIAVTPKDDDEGAREKLILHNMREALLYAKKCSYGKLADGDLVSVCYLGLRDAASNFAPNKIRFFGYSKPYIRGRIYSEFRSLRVVKKSDSVQHVATSVRPEVDDDLTGTNTPYTPNYRDNLETEYKPLEPESENFNFDLTQFREEWQLIEPLVQDILSDKERMILELRYISGYNFRQIGDLFAVPVSRSHVQHIHGIALEKIRAELVKRKLTAHHSEE